MPRTAHCSTTLVAGALAALALGLTACGTPAARPATGHLASEQHAERVRSSSRVIAYDEFDRVNDAPNALAAIERLRPLFLRPRPAFGQMRGRAPVISVFVNGQYSGNLDALRLISPDAVESARYLQPTEAITTLGAHHAADGVIMVQLRGFRKQ